jgi:hypothetical protein
MITRTSTLRLVAWRVKTSSNCKSKPYLYRQSSTGVNSIADFADRTGVSTSEMRQIYPTFVQQVQAARSAMRDTIDNPYLPTASRNLMKACLKFYDALAEIGLLSLT